MMENYQDELSRIKSLLKRAPEGMSVTEIARALNKNKNTVGRYLDILLISGHVMVRNYGMAKVFTLSQRVPLSAMLSYSNELIMVLDKDQRIIEINDQFLALLGLSRSEVVGKNSTYLTPPHLDIHEVLAALTPEMGKKPQVISLPMGEPQGRVFRIKHIPTVFDDGTQGITVILEDITDQVLAENALRESEERFRLMAEHIRDILLILEDRKIIYANRRLAEISGYSLAELQKMGQLDMVAPESREEFASQIRKIESGKDTVGEIRFWLHRKDRELRYIYGRMTSHVHEGKQYHYFILTDLTREKETEDALRESEARFRLMTDNIQDGIVIIEDEKFVYANRRISEISGYTPDELSALSPGTIVSEEDNARIEEIVRKVGLKEIAAGEIRCWITRKDGGRRFILGRVTAAKRGDISSIYFTMTDITDRTVCREPAAEKPGNRTAPKFRSQGSGTGSANRNPVKRPSLRKPRPTVKRKN